MFYLDTIKKQNGGTALFVILILGLVVVEIASASLLASYLVGQQGIATKRTQEIEAASWSGIDDALLSVIRDKNFTPSSNPYTLTIGQITVSVLVCRELTAATSTTSCEIPTLLNAYQVLSTATLIGQKSSFLGTISFDDTTGKASLQALQRVSVQ